VLWEKDGSVHDLGNFGGTGNALVGLGNMAFAINNQGQVSGASAQKGNTNLHAFRWSKETGLRDLGTLPGDLNSAGLAINDRGDIVGGSIDGPVMTGNPRAYLWQNGVMTDLNTLIQANSPFAVLLIAFSINSRGQIAGFGVTNAGDVHAFLATPAPVTTASAGPKNSTLVAREIVLDGTASISADGKPLTYLWSIPQGSPSAAILHGTTASPTVQFSPARGVYTFQLTVTDSTGTSASDLVTINFQGN
jgi:probable HAF family extracellular repeat protein